MSITKKKKPRSQEEEGELFDHVRGLIKDPLKTGFHPRTIKMFMFKLKFLQSTEVMFILFRGVTWVPYFIKSCPLKMLTLLLTIVL